MTNRGNLDGTEYYYCTNQQMIEARDGSENLMCQIVFGTQYVDEPVTLIDDPGAGEEWYFYHQNANYNTVLLTDETGLEKECHQYTPYGQTANFDGDFYPLAGSAVGNASCYTGRHLDPETGLYYYRARHCKSDKWHYSPRMCSSSARRSSRERI